MKISVYVGAITIVVLTILYFTLQPQEQNTVQQEDVTIEDSQTDDIGRISKPEPTTVPASAKLKADTFTGTLEKVDTGCFFDGECFIEVNGKHITVLMGWNGNAVGSVIGADGIGGLEAFIGKEVEVYAQDKSDGTYTLYGSEGFYVKPL